MKRRLKAVLEYDGTDFFGWQIQTDRRTVQGVLEEVLSQRFDRPVQVVGAGRTDKGVHAVGQAAHFDCTFDEPAESLYRSINAMLPRDIVLVSLEEVSDTFHARFSAVSRGYRYDICIQPSALSRRYSWEVLLKLNLMRMQKSLEHIHGSHSFKPLAKLSEDEKHYRCTIVEAEIRKSGSCIRLNIKADRFLHGMVRAITGTVVDVGKGAKEKDIFKHILEYSDRTLVGTLAPPQGLYLEKIDY